jgi:hypothetical protein
MTQDELKQAVVADQLASYARLRGGFPVPMAGIVYWLAVAALSFVKAPGDQVTWAFILSGGIFPLALLFAAVFKNPFMKDKTATGSVLAPAFVGMLLFWPMLVAGLQDGMGAGGALVLLAIGMGAHWPVIGWSYGRPLLFIGHAVVRALVVLGIFLFAREQAFLLIPLGVAGVYAVWVALIVIDSGAVRRRLAA